MKKTIFVTAMCVGLVAMSARAAEKAENPSVGASEKVSAIEAYVRSVEKNISSSQRKEQMLQAIVDAGNVIETHEHAGNFKEW